MSRPASRITAEREAVLRFFAAAPSTQLALREHLGITSTLATARIGNAIGACELRRVMPRPGQPMTPAVYEITEKGRAALNAIDNPPAAVPVAAPAKKVLPTHAKKLKAGAGQTPRELAVSMDEERRRDISHECFSIELLNRLLGATPRGMIPHARRGAPGGRRPIPMQSFPVAAGRDPCPRCGTRGDLGCAHQRAAASPADPFIAPIDGREQSAGRSGHHLRKVPSSTGGIAHERRP